MYTRMPEWLSNKIIYLAWPYAENLWQHNLLPAQQEFLELLKTLKNQEKVILVPDSLVKFELDSKTKIQVLPYGDIWLRDTLPIFVNTHHKSRAIVPKFNGWGNKYLFEADKTLASSLVNLLGIEYEESFLTFEGGSLEFDGAGTLLTTKQCLLNTNRNPGVSVSTIEEELKRLFGVTKIIWLDEGLQNDHTDGHVDTIARFIAPHTVAIMTSSNKEDPNEQVLTAIKNTLLKNGLKIVELPSPGKILDDNSDIMPASYLNFIFSNDEIIMPIYGSKYDELATKTLAKATNKKVIGLMAKAILTGGGAFHCMSQEYFL